MSGFGLDDLMRGSEAYAAKPAEPVGHTEPSGNLRKAFER
ncbi:hypothetical protein HNR21_000461 [Actinomadura cellulosilytica]|uniref:Uncharacterized protein n=1 Tax=Thermomonospora cellulosilytica TaxID=1411118 RepID=A0A7W3MTG8_9ACTN|nr:hypothetical protein [Thermomonospora cellulosilytica]